MSKPAPCSPCRGRGFVFNPEIQVGRYGTLELCSCVGCRCGGEPPYTCFDEANRPRSCACALPRRRMRAMEAMVKASEIPAKYRWAFRHDYQAIAPDQTPIARAEKIRSYIERLVESKERPRKGLLLHGQPGTGKSFLACIILNELMLHRGRPARFVSLSRNFFHRLRDTFSEDSQRHGQAYQILDELVQVPYVVLDDLGVQRGTEWEEEVLYDLVDGRYAEERYTIATTNESLDQIRGLSKGRIYSRLMEMCHVIELNGPDWRQVAETAF